ncbi:CAZyme family AA1 [Penicillium lividum]|nr:CAZyme family AA1 [Penicillium lividum]
MKLHLVGLVAYLFVGIAYAAYIRSTEPLLDASFNSPKLARSSSGKPAKITPCSGNSPRSRSAWCDYSISTDYENVVPTTGVTREYWFDIRQIQLAPDGFERPVWTVNGQFPGPTLFANWGDYVTIHVTNNLGPQENGTTIHWHGVRQNYTNSNDGVGSITQCPIAPGRTMTYTWRATQYGSSWYHAHFGLLAWEGIFGGIIINGPATANYDVDKGSLFLSDWTHRTVDELYLEDQLNGPTNLTNGLINGTNVYQPYDSSTVLSGQRFTMKVNQGTSYRLRLVNPAIDTHWKFSIDNHTMEVIAMDFVPIVPYTTDVISIGMGQRYDVIVTANQQHIADSFWMRAIPGSECAANNQSDNIRGIVYYGNKPKTPTTTGYAVTSDCLDEPMASLVPWVEKNVDSPTYDDNTEVGLTKNSDNLFRWEFNTTSMVTSWQDPTIMDVYKHDLDFSNTSNVIELTGKNEWVYLMINTSIPVPHPIHLHGHDFSILAQGIGDFDASTIITTNPPRRDTAVLPPAGWLLIAFETNNPGVWLMHCHIGWHTSEGLALQFVERPDEIRALVDYKVCKENCDAWDQYQTRKGIVQSDSGI